MNDRVRDLMDELVGDPPVVADWSGQVRRAVGVRRRRQQVLTAAAAVAVLAVAASTVALASGPARPDSLVGAVESSLSPVATASPSAPAPAAEPTAVPAETVQPEPAVEPSPGAEAPAGPGPVPEAEPEPERTYPPSGTQIIEITAQGRPDRPKLGQEWVLDVTVTGSADQPFLQDPCYDGGQCARVVVACVPREANYSPPPPRPSKVQRTFRHTFTTPGRHEVQLEADSGCSYYSGADELVLVVQVDEQPPTPTPSASPSPSAATSPAASPSP